MTLTAEQADQRMYTLADFLGIKLSFKPGVGAPGVLTGAGKWKQDCGLLTAKLGATILTSLVGDDTRLPMCILLGLSGDLGMAVYYVPETWSLAVLILDTSKLGGPSAQFFDREYCILPKDGFKALTKYAKHCFSGNLREKLVPVPPDLWLSIL